MIQRPDTAKVYAGLTPFQERTVEHVMGAFHGQPSSRRFLVADETGLGKSIIARGVVARTIDHLQQDPETTRIDIAYVCSNQDLARQNLRRLNVTGGDVHPMATRLSLLARESAGLNKESTNGHKPINLVSFTPGTSFKKGWSGGQAEERALLHVMLGMVYERHGLDFHAVNEASLRLFRGNVRTVESFKENYVEWPARLSREGRLDASVVDSFDRLLHVKGSGDKPSLMERTTSLLSLGADGLDDEERWRPVWDLTGELRLTLARAGVETLEPKLIILDEFQRFRDLLDPESESGELAHVLFGQPDARVLLLSATPYKPFTFAEEGEDHEEDFLTILRFLAEGGASVDVEAVREGFASIRDAARHGRAPEVELARLSSQLRRAMTRWERPTLGDESTHSERIVEASKITKDDLLGHIQTSSVAKAVARRRDHGLTSPEYWKSAPYFLNFCGGYKLGQRLTHGDDGKALDSWAPAVAEQLAQSGMLSSERIARFEEIDPGNARMRVLFNQTIEQDWWQLLWMPPTLPYVEPAHAYAEPRARQMTKRLVFSSWTATPAAVASLISYEAERRMANPGKGSDSKYSEYSSEGRRKVARGLSYTVSNDRPSNMTTLLMMWPLTRLSALGDVRAMARENNGVPLRSGDAVTRVAQELRKAYQGLDEELPEAHGVGRDALWRTAFNDPANWMGLDLGGSAEEIPTEIRPVVWAMAPTAAEATEETEPIDNHTDSSAGDGNITGLERHVLHALASRGRGAVSPDRNECRTLARIALFAPGCIALRVIRRLVAAAEPAAEPDELTLHTAAASLANRVRSLFQRPEVIALLGQDTYRKYNTWTAALHYCAHGNLESVLDEWLFHVWADQGRPELTDETLVSFIQEASEPVALRSATYSALDPQGPSKSLRFNGGLAARYGGRDQKNEDARQPQVRAAFNSPFWPFVLASTSVGQEGVDFHWWCHSVFHWNTPPNPVDFEQREGRVDRYHGHAVRKNIAEHHAQEILQDPVGNPWSVAYDKAIKVADELGFAPDWVYPGSAKIERHVAPIAFSTDWSKYERVKRDVAFYRVTLGQPRQEDMLSMLRNSSLRPEQLRLDLEPRCSPRHDLTKEQ